MNEKASLADTHTTLDSDRLFELEAEIRSGANWLIYLSGLTVFCGMFINPLLMLEGLIYLILAIVLRLKQSRAAALALLFAAIAAAASVLAAIISRSPVNMLIGFAMPEVALFVAAVTAYKVIRLERLLRVPLTPARHNARGV
jgi:4-hydroxybenzoate polyprenyltransferase